MNDHFRSHSGYIRDDHRIARVEYDIYDPDMETISGYEELATLSSGKVRLVKAKIRKTHLRGPPQLRKIIVTLDIESNYYQKLRRIYAATVSSS